MLEFAQRETIRRGHADIELRHLLLGPLHEHTDADAPCWSSPVLSSHAYVG
ncbi:hypothetical protein [Pseudonocardia alni]|uniref:hypothetical protein n=1 Tax=Pseudonocardia alni TaxID=33907 RepID=UPI00280AAA01|nr:hypothetical protein [Pseudonocardia alni]